MKMQFVDWAICGTLLVSLVVVALFFRRFGSSVTGFLAANRCAGRYLLCVASNMAQTGIITLVWFFQQYYDSGWTSVWWGFMENPTMIALALTGWVVYRFRETRALTLAQFFEERYSRSFRVFCGVVAFVAGIVNYAIFPAVSARFFMAMCGFPDHFDLLGVEWNTFVCIMALLLSMALFFVFVGGQIVIMAVDFLQGVFCNVAFLVIIGFCIVLFGWTRIGDTMLERHWDGQAVTWQVQGPVSAVPVDWSALQAEEAFGPDAKLLSVERHSDGTDRALFEGRPKTESIPMKRTGGIALAAPVPLLDGKAVEISQGPPAGRSMVNPFGIQNESNFNVFYWMISAFLIFYVAKAWQGGQGFNASALNAHEAKMAQILSGWKWRVLMLVALVVPVCVKVFMHHPDFAAGAAVVHDQINLACTTVLGNGSAGTETAKAFAAEIRTPMVLGEILPAGLMGLMAAAMLGAYISTDDSYLHSWGAILVQDVVLPFRKKPLSQRAHLWLLRLAIFGVAVFAFIVGLIYKPGQYIAFYAALTASVFVAGAGVCIIGGLYWRKGTTGAAWTAMCVGMLGSAIALVSKEESFLNTVALRGWAEHWWGAPAQFLLYLREQPWLTGQVLGFFVIVIAVTLYVGVSLWSRRPSFDLDRLLHRGRYRDAESSDAASTEGTDRPRTLMEKLGFTREFTGTDKWITWVTIAWPLGWTVVFVVFTAYNLATPVSDSAWMGFWKWWTVGIFILGIVIMIWFSIGGFRDLVRMYRRLKTYQVDARDDGTVAESGDELRGERASGRPEMER